MDIHMALRGLYLDLNKLIEEYLVLIESADAHVYQIDQLNPILKNSQILQQGGIALAKKAYQHVKLDTGETVKFVIRYPGTVFTDDAILIEKAVGHIDKINQLKDTINDFLKANGKPNTFLNEDGHYEWTSNDLLYKTLPMVNMLMLTRHIQYIVEPVKTISFGWNIDYLHTKISDVDSFIEKLHGQIHTPGELYSPSEWAKHIHQVQQSVELLHSQGVTMKIIRPKPVEPVMYVSFAQKLPAKNLKPKLPVLIYTTRDQLSLVRKKLDSPPNHSFDIKNSGRKFDYVSISEHFNLYAGYEKS